MTTIGTWYPPSLGVGGVLIEAQMFINPPFAEMTQDVMTTLEECGKSEPPADRIRLGDVWLDLQGRRHRADSCGVRDLMLMVPLDHQLVPVVMDPTRPHPWRRVEWGGQ